MNCSWKRAGVTTTLLLGTVILAHTQTRPNGTIDAQASGTGNLTQLLAEARAYNEFVTVAPNYRQAFVLFQLASQEGSVEAKAWLGSMYLRGHGTPKNLDKAYTLIREAAAANDPVGLRFMGMLDSPRNSLTRIVPVAVRSNGTGILFSLTQRSAVL